MTILPLSERSIAIFLEPSELGEGGMTAKELDVDLASPLVHSALDKAGIPLDGSLEIEAFTNREGVLMFARVVPCRPSFCSFKDLDELLLAAESVKNMPPDSALTYLDGHWWLTLRGDARSRLDELSEFGEREDMQPDFARHLAEHGQVILPRAALNRLHEYFA